MKKRVLFVCVENSCRSQMAEGFARELGGDTIEAYSSGSNPSGVVNAKAIESMKAVGIDLSTHHSKGLADLPAGRWDYAVTMGCGDRCPQLDAAHREDWDLPDPKAMAPEEFARVRDEIRARVEGLIELLTSTEVD